MCQISDGYCYYEINDDARERKTISFVCNDVLLIYFSARWKENTELAAKDFLSFKYLNAVTAIIFGKMLKKEMIKI